MQKNLSNKPNDKPVAALCNVDFSYGTNPVLHDISFSIYPGEFVAILGPNGVGKSTLVKLLSGTVKPVKGSVFLQQTLLSSLSRQAIAKQIAVVPQDANIVFPFQVLEVVLFGRFPHQGGLSFASKKDIEIAREALSQVGSLQDETRPVQELSGGERQRVLLARALAQDPMLLLLDEPTAHLDFAHQAKALQAVSMLVEEKRLSVIAVLHDLNLAALYASRVILLSKGNIVKDGSVTEVFDKTLLEKVYGHSIELGTHPKYEDLPMVLPCK